VAAEISMQPTGRLLRINAGAMSEEPNLSWSAMASFVRQFSHDVRNHLNALELETSLLGESIHDKEGMESVTRIRQQLRDVALSLKKLSTKIADPVAVPSPIDAAELFLIFKEQAAGMEGLPEIDWSHTLKKERINVDAATLAAVAKELLSNAQTFGSGNLKISGRIETKNVIYEFRESKDKPVEPEQWGMMPFISARRGGYGLGLWEARRIVAANGGCIRHIYQPETKELCSALSFPIN
jgi:signal transduction histidine kinase